MVSMKQGLVLVGLAGALAGCGGGSDDKTENTGSVTLPDSACSLLTMDEVATVVDGPLPGEVLQKEDSTLGSVSYSVRECAWYTNPKTSSLRLLVDVWKGSSCASNLEPDEKNWNTSQPVTGLDADEAFTHLEASGGSGSVPAEDDRRLWAKRGELCMYFESVYTPAKDVSALTPLASKVLSELK